ncbi:putative H(+)-transporting two-sector ATPase [Rosa chinensis]|uniref:Putative H(+)-transporting two-sector ATPase n=2 Tax=Rosa chinensis TaxID=74649 RepID=A0A2P6R5Y6_ROSCH|nr:putative H(+)-transporting two-sector ATPase [Rosa chinensis]
MCRSQKARSSCKQIFVWAFGPCNPKNKRFDPDPLTRVRIQEVLYFGFCSGLSLPLFLHRSVILKQSFSYQFQVTIKLIMAGRVGIPNKSSALIAMIADEDTVTGFLLAGVGNVDLRRKTNYLIVDSKTTMKQIEDAFKEFTTKDDIAIVLISQYVANMIRFLVDSYNKPVPAILEIPSKDHPYDPASDSVLSRVKYLFSAESVAGDRR